MKFNSSYIFVKRSIPLYFILLGIFVVASASTDHFFTSENILNVLVQLSPLLVVACGQTFVVLLQGIDISVGAVASLTTTVLALGSFEHFFGAWGPMFLIVVLGVAIGFLNGLMIYKGVTPIIMTLGSSVLVKGIALGLRPVPGGNVSFTIAEFFCKELGWIFSVPFLISITWFSILAFLLHFTRFGKYVYATGADRDVSNKAGINTMKITILAYILSSVSGVLAGLLLVGQIWSGDALIGEKLSLDSVTAVLVGGTTFEGGVGGLFGTLAGAFILSIMSNVLNMMNIFSYYQYVIKGLILIFSIFLSLRLSSRKEKSIR